MMASVGPSFTSAYGYFLQMPAADKPSYLAKTKIIGGLDPFQIDLKLMSSDPDNYPDVTYPDIFNYLVLSKNPEYTKESMKAYKGLEAFKQLLSGWVHQVLVYSIPNHPDVVIIFGKVCLDNLNV